MLMKAGRQGIDRFEDTLPVLMQPSIGGGDQTDRNGGVIQAFAAFVRSKGAQSLVFPSARSDVLFEMKHGRLERWRGWSLVDYRDAPPPLTTASVDLSSGWFEGFPENTEIASLTRVFMPGLSKLKE